MSPAAPVVAGSEGTWEFRFRTGPGGLPRGCGIVMQVTPFWGWSAPQTTNPDAPGFCTVTTTASCSLRITSSRERKYLLVTVEVGRLEPGDEVLIRYGDTSDGRHPRGAAVAEPYAEACQEFLFKTDGDGDGVFGEIDSQPCIPVVGRPATSLWVNAPSLVRDGVPFWVTVAALDETGNCDRAS